MKLPGSKFKARVFRAEKILNEKNEVEVKGWEPVYTESPLYEDSSDAWTWCDKNGYDTKEDRITIKIERDEKYWNSKPQLLNE